ncbi:Uncharacterised protein [uncultured archaeon]|nr:Uncharacterised protein [uncultured archaeon]
MTVIGDDILHACPKSYREKGFSVKLSDKSGAELVCEYDSGHRFIIEHGMLRQLVREVSAK